MIYRELNAVEELNNKDLARVAGGASFRGTLLQPIDDEEEMTGGAPVVTGKGSGDAAISAKVTIS